MALSKSVTLKTNFGDDATFNNAYICVSSVMGDKTMVVAKIRYYKRQGENCLCEIDFPFKPNLDGGNFIKQAYEHLKTLPEFAGATDC